MVYLFIFVLFLYSSWAFVRIGRMHGMLDDNRDEIEQLKEDVDGNY